MLSEARLSREHVGASFADGKITRAKATAPQFGAFLDALFGVGFGIRPPEGEADRAVGAEW